MISIIFAFFWQLCKFYLKRRRNEPDIEPDESKKRVEGVEVVELDEAHTNVEKQSKRTTRIFVSIAMTLTHYCYTLTNF